MMNKINKVIAVLLAVLLTFSSAAVVYASDAETPVLPSPVDNPISTSAFVKTVLKNPKVKQKNAAKLIDAAASLAKADTKIAEALAQDVLNGQNVILIINDIISALDDALAADPSVASLAGLIKLLFNNNIILNGLQFDEKFSGAAEKLQKALADGISTVPDLLENGIEFTSADFGFADGDAYGFLDALVCSLLEICAQINVRNVLGDFTDSTKGGAYVVGNYNLFIPLYELLELEPIDSAAFTERVTAAENAKDPFGESRLRAAANLTLKPVADLLTKIENKGMTAVIDLLPKLLYALDSGMVNDLVCDLLRDKNLYYMFQFNDLIADMDLNTDLVWEIIDKKYITGTEDEKAGFDFDQNGEKEATLPLTKEQFDALAKQLAYAADPIVKSSVSATQKNRLALKTDDALVSSILCETIVGLLQTDAGAAFAEKAVGGLDKKIDRWFLGGLLTLFRSDFGRFVLRNTQTLLASAAKTIAAVRSLRKA